MCVCVCCAVNWHSATVAYICCAVAAPRLPRLHSTALLRPASGRARMLPLPGMGGGGKGGGSGWQVIFRGLKRNQLQVDSEVYYSSQPVSIPPRPAKIHPPSTFRCQPGPRPAGSCQIRQHHQTCAHTLRTFSIVCLCKSDVTDATTATTMPTKALTLSHAHATIASVMSGKMTAPDVKTSTRSLLALPPLLVLPSSSLSLCQALMSL